MSRSSRRAPSCEMVSEIAREGEGRTSVNFIPRIIPSHGRTRTFTAVAKKRL